MTFGTKLQNLRYNRKISQKEISIILEVSQTIYGKWESDKFFPTYKNLKKIATFYDIDVETLVRTEKELNKVNSSEIKDFKLISKKKYLKEISKDIKELKVLLQRQIMCIEEREDLGETFAEK
ncbi:MAG: helix-turn-helix transcriptional regulator [Flavobacterium sp.]